jgi:hypothetical protein
VRKSARKLFQLARKWAGISHGAAEIRTFAFSDDRRFGANRGADEWLRDPFGSFRMATASTAETTPPTTPHHTETESRIPIEN